MPTSNGSASAANFEHDTVYIISAVRTPIGSMSGSLSSLKATDLGSIAVRKALEVAKLPADIVEKVVVGQALQAGSGQAAAKQVLIKAGLPSNCRDCLINEVCASGMQAVIQCSTQIKFLGAKCVIAVGMESMSNVPNYSPRTIPILGGYKIEDGLLMDGLTDTFNNFHMGNCAEHTAKKFSITREDQDNYAIESYRRAKVATESGAMAKEICSIEIAGKRNKPSITVSEDEEYKKLDTDKVKSLAACFDRTAGTITAANASSLSDGAAACVLMSGKAVAEHGVKPMAKIVSFGEDACDPIDFATSPIGAIKKALAGANLTKCDIALWEINEAFSVVALAVMKELQLDHSKVNVNGGGVSIGHPLGMSGARVVNVLCHQLKQGEFGCAAICRGGGGAAAVIVKKL